MLDLLIFYDKAALLSLNFNLQRNEHASKTPLKA